MTKRDAACRWSLEAAGNDVSEWLLAHAGLIWIGLVLAAALVGMIVAR